MSRRSEGRFQEFVFVTAWVTGVLWAVLLAGLLVRLAGADLAGDVMQIIVTVPWALVENATGWSPWVVRPVGALATGVLLGINAAARAGHGG